MASSDKLKIFLFDSAPYGPLVIEANNNLNPFLWIQENKAFLDNNLLTYGGILLRSFNINSLSEFNRVISTLFPNPLDYVYRSTPRTKLGGKIYTATEYPSDKTILLHNENSYAKSWPNHIIFFTPIVASSGGETPLADSRKIYNKIDPIVKSKFEKYGVLYTRNYSPGIDLTWQEVFQTDNKNLVEQFCKKNAIMFQWHCDNPCLTTKQICQASLSHPITHEKIWFNQAHLFHPSALDDETRLFLLNEIGGKNMPRNACYGNGEEIEIEVLDHIRQIYEEEKILFAWNKNDILILDNLLMAHGRQPYIGERKVVVAMA